MLCRVAGYTALLSYRTRLSSNGTSRVPHCTTELYKECLHCDVASQVVGGSDGTVLSGYATQRAGFPILMSRGCLLVHDPKSLGCMMFTDPVVEAPN